MRVRLEAVVWYLDPARVGSGCIFLACARIPGYRHCRDPALDLH